MIADRWSAGIVMLTTLVATALPPQASASPARRLARRGIAVAPAPVAVGPAAIAIVPSPFLLRPAPLVVAAVPPTVPTVVLGPRGRVRSVILPPVPQPAPLIAVAETVTLQPATVLGASPGPIQQQASSPPASTPRPLPTEVVPAPLPTPRPAPAGDVQPAGVELDIPDGTRSVLVQPAGGDTPPAADR